VAIGKIGSGLFSLLVLVSVLALACRQAAAAYTCNVPDSEVGKRIHETTSATPYDCIDTGCSNTCMGGQCVALATCRCTSGGQWMPGTNCWSPGAKLADDAGNCNGGIPPNTAIATFDAAGNYNPGHTAVFRGCSSQTSASVRDQWCCASVGDRTYSTVYSPDLYRNFYVVELRGGCSNRASWACRLENGGPTCCNSYQPGCLKARSWWLPESQ